MHVNGNASAFAAPLLSNGVPVVGPVIVDMGVLDESSRAIFLLPFLLSS